jgi:NAD(P)-dependent dehydrogenase (short-subunit alcohol dehydrogenase family)
VIRRKAAARDRPVEGDGLRRRRRGAARGIGLAIAERLAAEGAYVACVDVSARRLEPAVEAFTARGVNARGYEVETASRSLNRVFRLLAGQPW